MYGYIYMTINIFNGKRYIGQKKSNKFLTKYRYAGSGNLICESIKKYNGVEHLAIELLDIANSQEELNYKEWYWINYYNAVEDPMFYNLREGGDQPGISEETRIRMSIANKIHHSDFRGSNNPLYGKFGEDNPNYGSHRTVNSKILMSISKKGRKWINKNGNTKLIFNYDLDKYLSEGWSIGRK